MSEKVKMMKVNDDWFVVLHKRVRISKKVYQIYNKVLYKGSEDECDKYLAEYSKNHTFTDEYTLYSFKPKYAYNCT